MTYGVLVVSWLNCARYVVSRVYYGQMVNDIRREFYVLYLEKKMCLFAGRSFVSDT